MVKLTTNRGTAVQNINATFGKFTQDAQKLQKERLDVSGANTVLVTQRGTGTIQAKDIPAVSQPSLKGQKITTNRGTAVQNINATFGKFTQEAQKLQKERLDVSGADTVLSVQRGTATIQAKDIPAVSQPSLKGQKITTNRGTSTVTL